MAFTALSPPFLTLTLMELHVHVSVHGDDSQCSGERALNERMISLRYRLDALANGCSLRDECNMTNQDFATSVFELEAATTRLEQRIASGQALGGLTEEEALAGIASINAVRDRIDATAPVVVEAPASPS